DRDFDSIDDRGRRDVEAEVVGMKVIGVAAARRSLRVDAIIAGGIARGCPCHSAERDIVVRGPRTVRSRGELLSRAGRSETDRYEHCDARRELSRWTNQLHSYPLARWT